MSQKGFGGVIPIRRKTARIRIFHAVWHDSQALIGEFYRPLLIFALSVFVGGYAYLYLNNSFSSNPRLELVDMPYIMLALMVLEAPIEVPKEPYLILFWYLQPLLAVYIVGHGAANFVRLFFNRDERRDAWEVAVASTYRRHIIVIGVGHVGLRIIRELLQMDYEVVAVDLDVSREAGEYLRVARVPLVSGDAREVHVLEKASLKHAKAAIVATSNDHVNLEVTMRLRDMNPNICLVSRMWDSSLAKQIEGFFDAKVMSASDLVAPAFAWAAVTEIEQTLEIDDMVYNMIRLKVRPGSFMDGETVEDIQQDEGVDIVLLHKGENSQPKVHPKGTAIVRGGDTLVMFAEHDRIIEIVGRNEGK